MRLPALLCATTLWVVGALPVHAQWKWKDASGQVHLSDTPPPREVQDKDILQRPTAPQRRVVAAATTASAPASRPTSDPELEARKARAEADAQAKAKADEEKMARQRAENCDRARRQLAMLQSGQRIARIDAQGERIYLDDDTRAGESAEMRRIIASDCR